MAATLTPDVLSRTESSGDNRGRGQRSRTGAVATVDAAVSPTDHAHKANAAVTAKARLSKGIL
jgi:hypothetical protein